MWIAPAYRLHLRTLTFKHDMKAPFITIIFIHLCISGVVLPPR